jgi:NADP-dependent 3-hydroxy acid dehydrogenase YdfG
MKKTALITGATSGIGRATAEILARNEYRLIICGRREDRLLDMYSRLSTYTEVHSLNFDVRDREKVFQVLGSLPEDWKPVDVLINNAGNAHGFNSIQDGDIDDWDAMIDINIKGLLYVTKAVVPGMVDKKSGHIVNIGSIAGKEVYPNGNVYCASKFGVDAANNGMRIDLNQHNIKVSQVCPGLVETEFSLVRFKGNKQKSEKVYEGFDALTAEDIADLIYFIVSRPQHVNIADVTVLPTAQASSTIVNRG